MRCNETDIAKYLDQRWPESDWEPTVRAEFVRRVVALELDCEQAENVCNEYRMTRRNRTPVPADLLDMMRKAKHGNRGEKVKLTWLEVWRRRQQKAGARHGFTPREIVEAEAWTAWSKPYERSTDAAQRERIMAAWAHDVVRMGEHANQQALNTGD